MDTSLWSAGYATHLKIVTVALIASIVVVFVGMNGRLYKDTATARIEPASTVVKAGVPRNYAETGQSNIR